MQCKKCGKSVKYIKSHDNQEVFTVDDAVIQVVKDNGREVGGYLLHICEGKENSNDADKKAE